MSLDSYLVSGAKIYGEGVQDIRIVNGKISEIGTDLVPGDQVIVQAEGLICLPSFVNH